jgi:Transposase, Mutator family
MTCRHPNNYALVRMGLERPEQLGTRFGVISTGSGRRGGLSGTPGGSSRSDLARGMCTRDIQAHLRERYGLTISPDLVSAVTDAVIEEVGAWQNRPLEAVFAIVYFDALRARIRDEGTVENKAVYLAIAVRCSGHKEVLGIWIEQNDGAKFWLRVMTELKEPGYRGHRDRRGRWAERVPRSQRGGVPADPGADLYRALDPLLDAVRRVERT